MPDEFLNILEVVVGIGKNNKQYRRLVVSNDKAFDKPLIRKAMKAGVPSKDIRNSTEPWGDDDLPQ